MEGLQKRKRDIEVLISNVERLIPIVGFANAGLSVVNTSWIPSLEEVKQATICAKERYPDIKFLKLAIVDRNLNMGKDSRKDAQSVIISKEY